MKTLRFYVLITLRSFTLSLGQLFCFISEFGFILTAANLNEYICYFISYNKGNHTGPVLFKYCSVFANQVPYLQGLTDSAAFGTSCSAFSLGKHVQLLGTAVLLLLLQMKEQPPWLTSKISVALGGILGGLPAEP